MLLLLLQAEDVFSSLAIPLMTLVGLKGAHMAKQGRSTTFFITTGSNNYRVMCFHELYYARERELT